MTEIPEKLREKLRELAFEAKKRNNFALIYHYDADGIAAAGIIAKALEREGKEFKCMAVKQLYSETIEEIKGLGENYFFVDFGSGQLRQLKEEFRENFFVLDHHQPEKAEHNWHISPYDFGVDGGKEVSGAGMAYLFAKELNSKNIDLASLAVVGALGDMQDFGGKLTGLNQEIVLEAIQAKLLKKEIDLRLYGRISRPLIQFLVFASNPVLPELTASEENCLRFLQKTRIDLRDGEEWRSYADLNAEEKKALTSALIVHMHSFDVPEWKIKELIGEVYTLIKEKPKSPLRDAKEFSTLLNSCGRHGRAEIALAVCMGDREENYEKAISLLVEHRKQLREGIELLKEKGVEEKEEFYFFDAEKKVKDSIVGIIAGMLYGSGIIEGNKPIIAFARHEDGSIKVSGRGSQELVYKGLNLGKAFKEIEQELEGVEGGGHKIAAGCKIDEKQKEKFLKLLNEKIKKQMNYT